MITAEEIKMRAIDVKPHRWAVRCQLSAAEARGYALAVADVCEWLEDPNVKTPRYGLEDLAYDIRTKFATPPADPDSSVET